MPTQSEVDSVLETLERAPEFLVPMVREIPEEVRKQRPPSGKWSAHEHACHLAEVHELFFRRLDAMLAEDDPALRGYMPSAEEEAGSFLELDLDEEMERFAADRKRLVARLRELDLEDWNRTAVHPQYTHYSIFILFRHVAMHDHLHAYRIEEILLGDV